MEWRQRFHSPVFPLTYAGFYQINFTVPAGLQGTQPMVLSIGGKNSTSVSIPLFGISAVVSNASFASAGTNAPASIATLYANGLGTTDQTTGFPGNTFQGVSVIVNGRSAPLFHLSASANQIDFLMPTELPVSGTVNVQLTTPSGTSPNYTLTMAPAVPAFYRIPDPATKGRVNIIAQFANTAWLALPASTANALKLAGNCKASMANPLAACAEPAAPGDYLVIYTTGLGKTTPNGDPNGTPLATGAIPPADGSVLYGAARKTPGTLVVTAANQNRHFAPGRPLVPYEYDVGVARSRNSNCSPHLAHTGHKPSLYSGTESRYAGSRSSSRQCKSRRLRRLNRRSAVTLAVITNSRRIEARLAT